MGHDHNLEHLQVGGATCFTFKRLSTALVWLGYLLSDPAPPWHPPPQVPGARPDGAPASYAVVVTGAGSKTQRQQNGAAFSRWFYPYSGAFGGSSHLLAEPTSRGCPRLVSVQARPPAAADAPNPRPPATTCSAGFVGATVTPEALQLDYYTLEGGQAPAYSASIARQPTAPSAER